MSLFDRITVKDVKEEAGQFIRAARKKRGFSQDELAEQLNLSRITISNLEQGKNITLDTLLKAFQYFDQLDLIHEFFAELIKGEQQDSLY